MATAGAGVPAAGAAGATDGDEHRVTPLELFFDLVFVFAFTQVTARMADEPTWEGLAKGLMVLAAVWWTWVGYAWMTNALEPDHTRVRLPVFAAMAAMLVLSLAVPAAFTDDALVFGAAYLVVRVIFVGLFLDGTRDDPQVRAGVRRLAPPILLGPALVFAAGFLDGTAQGVLWGLALLVDYGGGLASGAADWRVHAGHFAERHGLIVIIALGESIVAVGVGASGLVLDAAVVVAAVLGTAVAAALWWAYFDVVAVVAERKLHEATGAARNRMARDSYSFLHLPMVAGIVLLALGMKKVLGATDEPLKTVPAVALCGGVALYLLAHVAFRWRNVRSVNRQRVVAAGVLLAFTPLATELDALAALAVVAAVSAALIAYEALRHREARARVRTAHAA